MDGIFLYKADYKVHPRKKKCQVRQVHPSGKNNKDITVPSFLRVRHDLSWIWQANSQFVHFTSQEEASYVPSCPILWFGKRMLLNTHGTIYKSAHLSSACPDLDSLLRRGNNLWKWDDPSSTVLASPGQYPICLKWWWTSHWSFHISGTYPSNCTWLRSNMPYASWTFMPRDYPAKLLRKRLSLTVKRWVYWRMHSWCYHMGGGWWPISAKKKKTVSIFSETIIFNCNICRKTPLSIN